MSYPRRQPQSQPPPPQRGTRLRHPARRGTTAAAGNARAPSNDATASRQQHGGGAGILADLNSLHDQRNRDIHAVFATATPLDSLSESVCVSGHLTPTDQWVAVGNASSGVISLTSSDNEEDRPDSAIGAPLQESQAQESQISEFGIGFSVPVDAQYRNVRPASMPVPQYTRLASSSHDTFDASPEDPAQTVHMLRESVASMLTAGSSSSSATSSANPARRRSRQLARFDRRRQQHQQQDVPRSPSHLSKVSEPCYPSGQRRPTVDFDHFSEIALSSSSPPQHPHPTMFPPYEEYHSQAGRVGMQAWQDSSSTNNRVVDATAQNAQQLSFRRRTNTSGSMNSENDAIVPSHYLPVDPRLASISSVNTRSPFASIQTISPVILPYNDGPVSVDATSVKRAQAEEALDQAILCPSGTSVSLEKTVLLSGGNDDAGAAGNSNNGGMQRLVKYTGYAILGFGVGTVVGMMCFDMAGSTSPKATRTIPLSRF